MKIKILALFAVLFIACSALHLVEPTSAASVKKGQLIDHGTKYYNEGVIGTSEKVTWKTYWYSKNLRKVVRTYYIDEDGNGKWKFNYKEVDTLQKVSKTRLKLKASYNNGYDDVYYIKTKLSTRNYYWNKFIPNISNSAIPARKGHLIDQKTTYYVDDEHEGGPYYEKVTWKAYSYGKNTIKVFVNWYLKTDKNGKYKLNYKDVDTLQKVSKTKLKFRSDFSQDYYSSYNTYYEKTKLSTRDFYWKKYYPGYPQ